MKATKELARQLAQTAPHTDNWSALRAWADLKTGSALDCFQLDLLTGWLCQEQDEEGKWTEE